MNENPVEILQDLSWVEPSAPWSWWIWMLLAAGCVLLAAGILVHRRRRKHRQETRGQAPKIPAHLTALEALKKLQARIAEENEMEFVIEVSRILRAYIQDRFELRAPHRSTEEFLREASESAFLSFEQQNMVSDFLGRCDRVKFARGHVKLGKMKELFAAAHCFVEETIETREMQEQATS